MYILELEEKFVVVVVGGGWWVVIRKFSVLLWSKPLTLNLKIWTWTKPHKIGETGTDAN